MRARWEDCQRGGAIRCRAGADPDERAPARNHENHPRFFALCRAEGNLVGAYADFCAPVKTFCGELAGGIGTAM